MTPAAVVAKSDVPMPSGAGQQLVAALQRTDTVDIRTLSTLIAKDPAITAYILRRANSPSLGHSRQVGSIGEAVQLLGLKNTSAIAVAAYLESSIPIHPCIDKTEFWSSCSIAADFANKLSYRSQVDSGHAWLCAFVLRLGETILSTANADSIKLVEAKPRTPGQRWARESELFGFTEAAVTSELVKKWNFPSEIVQSLAFCAAEPEEAPGHKLPCVVKLSWLLAEAVVGNFHDPKTVIRFIPEKLLAALDISAPLILDIYGDYVSLT